MTLLSRAMLDNYPAIIAIDDDSIDSIQSETVIRDSLLRQEIFLILNQNQIVGFLIEKIIDGSEAELIQIVVSKDWRQRGLAAQGLLAWHENLRVLGVETVFLEVREQNSAARALYHKLGYQQVGRRKNYYNVAEKRQDALVMKVLL